jgi:hypothetical protein
MRSFRPAVRRLSAAVAAVAAIAAGALVVAPPAQAVSYDAYFGIKGVGTAYSYFDGSVVALAGSSGQTLSFPIKVGSFSSAPAQYNLRIASSGLPATIGLYSGSTLLTTASTADGYYTVPIPPQALVSYTLKVKTTLPVGATLRHTAVAVTLSATDGTFLQGATARFEIKAPLRGSALADGYARSGSLPYVGSLTDTQDASSPSIGYGDTAKFTVKQAVNAGAPHRLHAYMPTISDPSCFSVKVLSGTTDVTAAVHSGAYLTKVLSPGQSSLLSVQVSGRDFQFCHDTELLVYTYTEDGQSVSAVRLLIP